MSEDSRKLLVVQVAGLGCNVVTKYHGEQWGELKFRPMKSVFPAVTCSAQASFRTATEPIENGMVGNGFFDRKLRKVFFWEQSSALVEGQRIWEAFRSAGKSVAMLFWQQSMGEDVDMVLSPAPIHKHHGGMIQDCYSKPDYLYGRVCEQLGRSFELKRYWGPVASVKASAWITEATAYIMGLLDSPDLCMTYLPGLDYDLQRYGPFSSASRKAVEAVFEQLDTLKAAAIENGYDILVFGDYAIGEVTDGPVHLNRVLKDAGCFVTRDVKGMQYPDLNESSAFAVADHEVAQVYVRFEEDRREIAKLLGDVEGVEQVQDTFYEEALGMNDHDLGDLIAVAKPGYWFAYPWWEKRSEAPEFATHVDIHNKPGYDPCELFFGLLPWNVCTDATRIKGTHGALHEGREVCWTSSLWNDDIGSMLELSRRVKEWLS